MSDTAHETEGESNSAPKEMLALALYLNPDGTIRLDGTCINDKTLAYGLLETMRDLIYQHHVKIAQEMKARIVKANGNGMMNFLRGHK